MASTDLATVCAPGCSRRVRPPAAHTDAAKARQLAAGYPGATGLGAADVEEDHLVIALGGDPRSEQNRWPQPRHIRDRDSRDVGAPAKDGLEGWLYDQACHRQTVPLARTQAELATDWYAAWLAARRPNGSTGSPG